MLSRLMFAYVDFAARKGLSTLPVETSGAEPAEVSKQRARGTGIGGETYAYWYLRRHGYIVVAKNYRRSGMKGEIDLIGYDGRVLAFVEVKTRSACDDRSAQPEEAVNFEKRGHSSGWRGNSFANAARIKSRIVLTSSPSNRALARVPRCACIKALSANPITR